MRFDRFIRRWLSLFSGRHGGAEAAGQTAHDDEDPARIRLEEAFSMLQRGQAQEAAQVFETIIAMQPRSAAAHRGLGRALHDLESFEAAADSLHRALQLDPGDGEAFADLAAALSRLGSPGAAGAADEARRLGPKSARGWEACAFAYKAAGALARALECYEAACRMEPDSAHFACQCAFVRFSLGDYAESEAGYLRALALDPNHLPAMHNLGLLELETGRPEAALGHFRSALALQALPQTQACIAHALRDCGRLEEASAVYEAVLAQHPAFGDARANYAQTLLMRRDYERGWREYERRFEAAGVAQRRFGLPVWQGEPLAGKRLLVFAEQGVGDEIMFASCLPDVLDQAQGCVIECDPRLAPLFARSFPRATVHGGRKSDDPSWLAALPPCDFEVAIGGLPRFFRQSSADFPQRQGYLVAGADRVRAWRQALRVPGRQTVGFAWSGGALRSRTWLRSIPMPQWEDLLRTPGCRFVALQHGEAARELRCLPADPSADVVDLCERTEDLDELAAVVSALDTVVSVDNALVHLSGALGIRTYVLLPEAPEWRYPRQGERMDWYSCVRLFRQDGPRSGARALGEIARQLAGSVQPCPTTREPS